MKHSIHGKEILAFDPQITCTENDVIHYLQRFSLVFMLRRIADIDESLVENKGLTYVGEIYGCSTFILTTNTPVKVVAYVKGLDQPLT